MQYFSEAQQSNIFALVTITLCHNRIILTAYPFFISHSGFDIPEVATLVVQGRKCRWCSLDLETSNRTLNMMYVCIYFCVC